MGILWLYSGKRNQPEQRERNEDMKAYIGAALWLIVVIILYYYVRGL